MLWIHIVIDTYCYGYILHVTKESLPLSNMVNYQFNGNVEYSFPRSHFRPSTAPMEENISKRTRNSTIISCEDDMLGDCGKC